MLSNGIIGNLNEINDAEQKNKEIDFALVEWFDAEKSILKLATQAGRDVGIRQPAGKCLHSDDIIYKDDKLIVAVKIKPSKLLRVKFEDSLKAGRVCYELGNRHLPVSITENEVTVPYDEPTELYLNSLGFEPECIVGVFAGSLVKHHHAHE
jgi:urease accessory protein